MIMDGEAIRSCVTPVSAVGKRTSRLSRAGKRQHPHYLQKAFIEEQAAQCGYCMNGMIMTAKVLLDKNPHPDRDEIKEALNGVFVPLCSHLRVYPRGQTSRRRRGPEGGGDRKMETKSISRRQFVKDTGALIVASTFWSGILGAVAAEPSAPFDAVPEATSLDSWLMASRRTAVSPSSRSKVDLGTGIITALSQIVAEELDVPFSRIQDGNGRHDADNRPGRHRRQPHHRERRAATASSGRCGAPRTSEISVGDA